MADDKRPARSATGSTAPAVTHRLFSGTPKVAYRGAFLAKPGEPCCSLIFLVTGWASRQRMFCNGSRAVIELYLPGDLVWTDGGSPDPASNWIVAMTDVTFHTVDGDSLQRQLRGDIELWQFLLLQSLEAMRRRDRHIARLARLPAIERAAAFLVQLCERVSRRRSGKEEPAIRIPLTQRDLADYLGLNVIHMNRTLRALRAAGAVRTENYGIVVDDVERLRNLFRGIEDAA
jgi:CRP-like cAMP-binding protein